MTALKLPATFPKFLSSLESSTRNILLPPPRVVVKDHQNYAKVITAAFLADFDEVQRDKYIVELSYGSILTFNEENFYGKAGIFKVLDQVRKRLYGDSFSPDSGHGVGAKPKYAAEVFDAAVENLRESLDCSLVRYGSRNEFALEAQSFLETFGKAYLKAEQPGRFNPNAFFGHPELSEDEIPEKRSAQRLAWRELSLARDRVFEKPALSELRNLMEAAKNFPLKKSDEDLKDFTTLAAERAEELYVEELWKIHTAKEDNCGD